MIATKPDEFLGSHLIVVVVKKYLHLTQTQTEPTQPHPAVHGTVL